MSAFPTSRHAAIAVVLALATVILSVPGAHAAWAVAFVEAGKPIVVGGGNRSGAAAKEQALALCKRQSGKDCKIVLSGNNNCAAFANTYRGGGPDAPVKWGFGAARTKSLAGDIAVKDCEARHAGVCRVAHDFCGP